NILKNKRIAGKKKNKKKERNIESETGKIYKKASRIPLLNKELQNLDELAVTENKLKKQESLYAEIKLEQQSNKTQLNSLLNDIKHARQKLDQYNKQLHLLPTIND